MTIRFECSKCNLIFTQEIKYIWVDNPYDATHPTPICSECYMKMLSVGYDVLKVENGEKICYEKN